MCFSYCSKQYKAACVKQKAPDDSVHLESDSKNEPIRAPPILPGLAQLKQLPALDPSLLIPVHTSEVSWEELGKAGLSALVDPSALTSMLANNWPSTKSAKLAATIVPPTKR